MLKCPEIHPLPLSHLKELKERWGVEPSLSESLWIVRLCDRVLNPNEGERSDLCGFPHRAGVSDVWLWPVTIGASVWLQDKAAAWFGSDNERMFHAFCFALANGRDKATMHAAGLSKAAAERMVKEWCEGLTCTPEELGAAFDAVCPAKLPSEKENTKSKINWDMIVGELEAAAGIPADHWLWEVSKEATVRAWHRSRMVLLARSGGGISDGIGDPLTEALQDLANAKAAIIEAHTKQEAPSE
jgi:hypothetical protein